MLASTLQIATHGLRSVIFHLYVCQEGNQLLNNPVLFKDKDIFLK
jgi:hypothetical protein